MQTKVLSFLARYGTAIAIGVGVCLWVIYPWLKPPPGQTFYRIVERPYRADQGILDGVDTKMVQVPVYAPSERQRAKIEKKVGADLPPGEIVAVGSTKGLPYGANLIAYLPPVRIGEDGSVTQPPVEILVVPKKQPLFASLVREREVGAYVGFGKGLQTAYSLEYRQGLFRVGPLSLEGKAGVIHTPALTDYYVMVGGKVRF